MHAAVVLLAAAMVMAVVHGAPPTDLCSANTTACPVCLTSPPLALAAPLSALRCAPADADMAAAIGGALLLACDGANCSIAAAPGGPAIACALSGCAHDVGRLVCAQPSCSCADCDELLAGLLTELAEPVAVACDPDCALVLGELSLPIVCAAGACADAPPSPTAATRRPPYPIFYWIVLLVGSAAWLGTWLWWRWSDGRMRQLRSTIALDDDGPPELASRWMPLPTRASSELAVVFDVQVPGRLERIIGAVRGRGVVGVLGPSGIGKTTLLQALAGRPLPTGARASVTGGATMLVQQDDLLDPSATVFQTLLAAAELAVRRPYRASVAAANAAMNDLGLTAVADRTTARLSGGQRRRVSIGVAVVCQPEVLILDEPTSGLDAATAHEIMQMLHVLAGRALIIASLHSPLPEDYAQLMHVILLGVNERGIGELRFDGPPSAHAETDPLRVAEQLRDADIERSSPLGSGEISADSDNDVHLSERRPPHALSGVSLVRQLRVLLRRAFVRTIATPDLLLAHVAGALALGAFMAYIYFDLGADWSGLQNRGGFIFVTLAAGALTSITSATQALDLRALQASERANGLYGALAHALVASAVDAVLLRALPAVVYTTICYRAIGLAPGGEFFFVGVVAAANAVTATLCAAAAVAIRAPNTTVAVCALFCLGLMLFGGLLVNGASLPPLLALLRRGSYFASAFELLMIQQIRGRTVRVSVGRSEVGLGAATIMDTLDLRPSRERADALVLGLSLPVAAVLHWLACRLRR